MQATMGSDNESSTSSFEDRRKMFKSIWDSALAVNQPAAELKKRIYRYIHVEEGDVSKADSKKEKIKHLRAACNKILKICDNHEVRTTIIRAEVALEPSKIDINPKKSVTESSSDIKTTEKGKDAKNKIKKHHGLYKRKLSLSPKKSVKESKSDIESKEQINEKDFARNKMKRNQPFDIRRNKVMPKPPVLANVVTISEDSPLPMQTVNAWPANEEELLPDNSNTSVETTKKKKRKKRRRTSRKMTTVNNITITLPRKSKKKPLLKTPVDSRSEKIRNVLAQSSGGTARVRRVRRKKKLSPLKKLVGKIQLNKETAIA